MASDRDQRLVVKPSTTEPRSASTSRGARPLFRWALRCAAFAAAAVAVSLATDRAANADTPATPGLVNSDTPATADVVSAGTSLTDGVVGALPTTPPVAPPDQATAAVPKQPALDADKLVRRVGGTVSDVLGPLQRRAPPPLPELAPVLKPPPLPPVLQSPPLPPVLQSPPVLEPQPSLPLEQSEPPPPAADHAQPTARPRTAAARVLPPPAQPQTSRPLSRPQTPHPLASVAALPHWASGSVHAAPPQSTAVLPHRPAPARPSDTQPPPPPTPEQAWTAQQRAGTIDSANQYAVPPQADTPDVAGVRRSPAAVHLDASAISDPPRRPG
jgi:hypothetical protein